MSKQIINVGSGELVGDGEGLRSAFIKINGNFDEVYAGIAAVPTNLSGFNNDVGYITTASIPTNISAFNNDVGYITTEIFTGTNVSVFVNDAGYITANIFTNTNVGDLINNVGYLTIDTLPPATNLGNLVITGTNLQTIAGTIGDVDIELLPDGVGTVRVPSLTLPSSSLVAETLPIEVIIANLTLDTIVDYSTGTGDTLTIGTVGNTEGIAHPWAIYRFTTTPDPVLEVDDIIAGAGVPLNSQIVFVGTDAYSAYIVTNKIFPLGVPTNGITISTVRATVNASLSISTALDTDIALKTGGGLSVVVPYSSIIPSNNNTYDLGSPTKRFRQLWLGGGTIYIADDVLGTDISLAAHNGDLVVQGGKGLEVGEFRFSDNQLFLTNPNREILIGTTGATAPVTFKRTIQVRNSTDEYNLLNVDQQGRVTILSEIAADPTEAAMSIVGARARDVQSPTNLGVLLQLTGTSLAPTRLYSDSYGAVNYSAFIGRNARGNSTVPTQTLSGDIIARVGANPHDGTAFAPISTMRMDFVNAEDQSVFGRGSKLEFWTTPIGSTTIGKRVTIDGTDIVLTASGLGGIKFQDSTRQTTAWTGTVHVSQVIGTEVILATTVRSITAGAGITVTTSTGNVGINATGVQTTVGTANQVIVTDSGNKNLTLSLPQNINSTASVTFDNITVNNINVLGTSTVAYNLTLEGKILYLASSATNSTQIEGGGIQLGTGTFARSILYSNGLNDYWYTDPGTGFQTEHLSATTGTFTTLFINEKVRFGTAYSDYDFPNAITQSDGDVNSYLQDVVKNHNSGTNASSGYAAMNDQGSDGSNFITFGIASSAYNNPGLFPHVNPSDSYILNEGGDLIINPITTGSNIRFYLGGNTEACLEASITENGLNVVNTLTAAHIKVGTLSYEDTGILASLSSNNPTYNQLILQNTNAGSTASVNVIVSNDLGTASTYYGQFGMNSSGFTGAGALNSPNNVYLTSVSSDLAIGTVGANDIRFFVNGGATDSMRIFSNGVVSAGTFTAITVNGLTLPSVSSTSGYVLSNNGSGITSWVMPQTGYVGSRGNTGTQGITGFTGSRGTDGVIGYNGSTGYTGSAGAGYTGSQGATGNQGYTGSQGVIGFTGSKGDTGALGNTGATGFTGSQGNTGTQGVIGFTGSKGDTGALGNTGATGFTGSKGDTGSLGFTGSAGAGYTGSAGIGYTGSASTATGYTGSVGFTGSKGDQGSPGYTGSLGYTGSAGVNGVTSITGGNNIILSTSTGAVSITRIDGSQTIVTNNSTATYTLLSTDQYFGSTRSTAGSCTVNLPLGSTVPVGRQYIIKDEGGQSGIIGRRVTLAAAGSDTIDGSATRTITSNYGALTVLWTGSRWSVI